MSLFGFANHLRSYKHMSMVRENLRYEMLLAIALDLLIGHLLVTYISPSNFCVTWWETLSWLIEQLDQLIVKIVENPAGLKLNENVNNALASFFQYHIFLWQTFVEFLRNRVPWNIVLYSGYLGLSTMFAVLADAVTIMSLHIKCFDIYASR
ncbi:unnamed protein product [Auanema sp. JU1783]|nr:unnamed protein product [Auanema sp. JU1783]